MKCIEIAIHVLCLLFILGIQKLVLAGRMGEAIDTTQQLYPGLLERNANLLFMLKCRQFIEMVNGTDSEVRGASLRSPRSHHSGGSSSSRSSPSMSPVHPPSSSSSSSHSFHQSQHSTSGSSRGNSPNRVIPTKGHSSQSPGQGHNMGLAGSQAQADLQTISEEQMNAANSAMNGISNSALIVDPDDIEMRDGLLPEDRAVSNGTSNGECLNGAGKEFEAEDMGELSAMGFCKHFPEQTACTCIFL